MVRHKAVVPRDLKITREQAPTHLKEAPALDRIIRHLVAGFLPARHAGRGRHQANRLHLISPFLVVVAAARWSAVLMLPQVAHLMNHGPHDLDQGDDRK